MTLWLVRAGKYGEREDLALEQGLAVIGFMEISDLSGVKSQEELRTLFAETYPEEKRNTIRTWAAQLWMFLSRMQVGDLVTMPLKKRSAIAIGKIKGPYQFRPDLPEDAQHTRPVQWLKTDVPRSIVGQDLLYSLGAFLTVCQIKRNNAEQRIQAILATGKDPGYTEEKVIPTEEDEVEAPILIPSNLEEYSRDQIRDYVGRKFKGHRLAGLVAALLETEGYQTYISPEGPDGGVDIIAGRGPMGFDPPRLCVQVKSSDQPVDVKVFRELQGVMPNFGAQQGLLVSWGGFRDSVYREARQKYFQIRLWDAGDVVETLLRLYDQLPADIQADLPLKRIWTLVLEEE